ncbi:MAG TPA: PHB depolymerase family esterase [Pseudonocardia sp.]
MTPRQRARRPKSLLSVWLRPRMPRRPRSPAPVARPRRPARRPAAPTARGGRWVQGPAAAYGSRSYDVYLPKGHRRSAKAPLVMLLHGCLQTPAEFADASRFTAVADRNGFLLVVPHQEGRHHPQRCWRWYESRNQLRGAGEPAVLATILLDVLAETSRWRVEGRQVYVAGLSAGGAMAMTLAATYPDLFAAAGVHSAPAYRSATGGSRALAAMAGRTPVPPPAAASAAIAPLIVVQGRADGVVAAANAERIADQWMAHHSAAGGTADAVRARVDKGQALGRGFTRVRWYSGSHGRRVLEVWQVDRLGHAWSGGRAGGSYSDPEGPRASTLMWNFFRTHAH